MKIPWGIRKWVFSPKGPPAFKISVMQLSTTYFSKQKKAERYAICKIIERKGPIEVFLEFFIETEQWIRMNSKFLDATWTSHNSLQLWSNLINFSVLKNSYFEDSVKKFWKPYCDDSNKRPASFKLPFRISAQVNLKKFNKHPYQIKCPSLKGGYLFKYC